MTEELCEIKDKLEKKLKKSRFEHTMGVTYTAASLAMRYGEDVRTAMTAGLLHDCAKFCSADEQIALCKKYHVKLTKTELQIPSLVHAHLGKYLAEHEYGIHEPEILEAIRWHTTGRPEMSMLEKIIYLADYIEPNRKEIPVLGKVRKKAFKNIDKAIYLSAEGTILYLKECGRPIDPMSEITCAYYRSLCGKEKQAKK